MSGGQQSSLRLQDKCLAAGGASIISALVVNPLDVVKTRMQAQQTVEVQLARMNTAVMGNMALAGCPPACAHLGNPDCGLYAGTLDGMRKIVRREGALALWRGTDVALLMAIPTVGVYLPLYDYLLARLMPSAGFYAPLMAGSVARTVAVLCTSPLELVRTRMQAYLHPAEAAERGGKGAKARPVNMWSHLPASTQRGALGRISSMWRGVGATLARDVPFSAIYWSSLEPIRHALLPKNSRASHSEIVAANFAAGTIGGTVAAAVTTPLDVVKTRTQLAEGKALPIWATLRQVHREGGTRALFTGVGPRAVRAAPACAIVLASYEVLKAVRLG
ncbi:Solute carrier family 25 member 40 [Coccomyxa sp. Obi]|nr:Solute carrier family 25 member 40 [Coccomyxa sp. Obi]